MAERPNSVRTLERALGAGTARIGSATNHARERRSALVGHVASQIRDLPRANGGVEETRSAARTRRCEPRLSCVSALEERPR
jgi:hypothetical protein